MWHQTCMRALQIASNKLRSLQHSYSVCTTAPAKTFVCTVLSWTGVAQICRNFQICMHAWNRSEMLFSIAPHHHGCQSMHAYSFIKHSCALPHCPHVGCRVDAEVELTSAYMWHQTFIRMRALQDTPSTNNTLFLHNTAKHHMTCEDMCTHTHCTAMS
jgi:hypothetical protein